MTPHCKLCYEQITDDEVGRVMRTSTDNYVCHSICADEHNLREICGRCDGHIGFDEWYFVNQPRPDLPPKVRCRKCMKRMVAKSQELTGDVEVSGTGEYLCKFTDIAKEAQ